MRGRLTVPALRLAFLAGFAKTADSPVWKPRSHAASGNPIQRGRRPGRWPEAEQFSPANNAVIHRVVTEVVARRRSSLR